MTFNSPHCRALSLVPVNTPFEADTQMNVLTCALVPSLSIYTLFFVTPTPPVSHSLLFPLSDRLGSVAASAGIPHTRAETQGTLADTTPHVCMFKCVRVVCVRAHLVNTSDCVVCQLLCASVFLLWMWRCLCQH